MKNKNKRVNSPTIKAGRDINAKYVGTTIKDAGSGHNSDSAQRNAVGIQVTIKWLVIAVAIGICTSAMAWLLIPGTYGSPKLYLVVGLIATGVATYFNPANWHRRVFFTVLSFYIVVRAGTLYLSWEIDTPLLRANGLKNGDVPAIFDVVVGAVLIALLFVDRLRHK